MPPEYYHRCLFYTNVSSYLILICAPILGGYLLDVGGGLMVDFFILAIQISFVPF